MTSVTLQREELINLIDEQIRKNREKELSQGRVSFFQPEHYTQLDINLIERMAKVEKSIENILEQIKLMIDMFNKRFEDIDKRFEAIDKRFEDMRYYTEKRFDESDKKINLSYWIVGIGYTSLATLITYFNIFP